MAGVILDIFFLKGSFDVIVFFLLADWIILTVVCKLGAKFSFYVSMLLLLLSIFLSFFQKFLLLAESPLESSVKWVYLFLLVGLVKQSFEIKDK